MLSPNRNNFKTFELRCRFTNELLGTIEYNPSKYGNNPTAEKLGIDDTRCTICEKNYGNYKKLERDAENAGLNKAEIKTTLKKGSYKKEFVNKEIHRLKANKINEVGLD